MLKVFTRIAFLGVLLSCWNAEAQTARVQIVHNSPNAPAVDVFLNNTKILNGVPFRAASPFIDAPAGSPFQVRIKAASASADTSSPVFYREYTLEQGQGYYLIANGNLGGGNPAPNPDGIATAFDVSVIPGASETSALAGNVDLRIFHGSTDAPTVDIKAQGVGTLVDNAPFRGFSSYLPVPAASYTVQIAPSSGTPNLLAYAAPLSSLAGKTALVLASGYFNPAANQVNGQNGPAFGLWAFTPTGEAIQLPAANSRVQIVHNCANAPAVDIFVNGAKAVPNLDFRKATPFVNLNAGVPLTISIKAASASQDTSNPVFRQTYELSGADSYTIAATGLLTSQGFAANPDGIATGFDLTVMPGAREISQSAAISDNADIRVLHAATDAPFVDVRVQGGPTLVNNAGFRNFTPYLSAPNADLVVEITDSAQAGVVAAFQAPLSAFADSALVVMASGFLNSGANQNGPAFGLLAVTPAGNAILLPVVPASVNRNAYFSAAVYPNPAAGAFQIRVPSIVRASSVSAIDVLGKSHSLQFSQAGSGEIKVLEKLQSGFYQIIIRDEMGYSYRTGLMVK
jgi:hypothetical protein